MPVSNNFSKQRLAELLDTVFSPSNPSEVEHLSDEDVVDYVLGSIPMQEIERIDRHKNTCHHCAESLRETFEARQIWDTPEMQAHVQAARAESLARVTGKPSKVTRRQSIASGIAKLVTNAGDWFDFSLPGLELCDTVLGPATLNGAKRPSLPESLPIAIQSMEACENGRLLIRLCWLQETAPQEPPRVEVEFREGQFTTDVQWRRWQTAPRAIQLLEITGTDLSREEILAVGESGLSLIAFEWTAGKALRLRILSE
ncbi:MAG: hypothetical protein ACRER2_01315 [Methylococcales bacterium]